MKFNIMSFALAVSISLPCAAFAGSIGVTTALMNQTAFGPNGTVSVTLPQFDAALGTLTSATLQLDVYSGPQFEVLNLGAIAGTGIGTTVATYSVTGSGVAGLSGSASSGTQTVTVPGGFLNLASSAPVYSFIDPSVSLSDLSALVGTGSVDYLVGQSFTTSGMTSTVGATLAFGGSASSSFLLSTTYDYLSPVSVPEPGSLVMLGSGLLALGLLRQRRRD